MSIRELTWQIKQVVWEAQNFTSILPSLRIFSLKLMKYQTCDRTCDKIISSLACKVTLNLWYYILSIQPTCQVYDRRHDGLPHLL